MIYWVSELGTTMGLLRRLKIVNFASQTA